MKEVVHARRQFFRGMLRNVSLMLLGVAGGVAVTKRRRLVREGKCVSGGVCSGCDVLDECGLPRGLSTRLARERTRDGR